MLLGVQEGEGVVDALFEELVGESPVGQGAGELQGAGEHAEEAESPQAGRGRVVGCQAGGEVVDEDECAVGVGLPGGLWGAGDLVEEGGVGAAVVDGVALLGGEVPADQLFEASRPGATWATMLACWARIWSATAPATSSSLDVK